MEYFSNASKIDLIVWALTVGLCVPGALRVRKQEEEGKSKIGRTKESTAGSSIRVTLAIFGQVGATVLPTLVYWTVIPWNGFRQPEWMTKYALPSPPDVFGIDGVVVGRAVGLLGFFASRFITDTSFKALGDQYHPIGVSSLILSLWYHRIRGPAAYVFSLPQIREKHKLVDSGPYAYVRHPIYS